MGELVSLCWPSHTKQLIEGLWTLFNEHFQTDFELYAEGNNFNCGRELHLIRVHHLMLSIFCPSLRNVYEKNLILGKHLDIQMDDLTSLVEFIYRGKIDVAEDRLMNLRRGAETLGLKVLVELIESYLSSKNCEKSFDFKEKTASKRKGKPIKIPRQLNDDDANDEIDTLRRKENSQENG